MMIDNETQIDETVEEVTEPVPWNHVIVRDWQAEEAVDRIAVLEERIRFAQAKCDELKHGYEQKILAAEKIFEDETKDARGEILALTESLRRFAESKLTGKKRSITLPSGTLAFRKQPPKFFFGDREEVNARDPRLIDFVKTSAPDYLKVTESADWAGIKRKLKAVGENVVFKDTGEVIEGMRAQVLPETFTVKPATYDTRSA